MTSRAFNQDASGAKKAAQNGPVFITDRGRTAHVLLTIDEYQRLAGRGRPLAEALSMGRDDDIDFDPPRMEMRVRPAEFD